MDGLACTRWYTNIRKYLAWHGFGFWYSVCKQHLTLLYWHLWETFCIWMLTFQLHWLPADMWEICAFSMHSLHHLLPPLRKRNNLRGHKTMATAMSFRSIPEIFTKRHLLFKHCICIYDFIYIWFYFASFTMLLIFICCNGCIDAHLTRLINITYLLISLTLNLLVSGHAPCISGL